MSQTKTVAELKIGDFVSPPMRELSLWMRRDAAEKGFPESALGITLKSIREGTPDKRGRWLLLAGYLPLEWYNGNRYLFTFKARPETPWTVKEIEG